MPLPSVSEDSRYLTIRQVAERCGVAYFTAYEWVVRYRLIPGAEQLPNRMWRIPVDGLARFLAEHTETRVVLRPRKGAA